MLGFFKKLTISAVLVSMVFFAAVPAFASTAGIEDLKKENEVLKKRLIEYEYHKIVKFENMVYNLLEDYRGFDQIWKAGHCRLVLPEGPEELEYQYHACVYFHGGSKRYMPVYQDVRGKLYLLVSPCVPLFGDAPLEGMHYIWDWVKAYKGEITFGPDITLPAEFVEVDGQDTYITYPGADTPLEKFLDKMVRWGAFILVRNGITIV